MSNGTSTLKNNKWKALCQRCFHPAEEHPKNHDGNRPCRREMKFTGMSVFCYCDGLSLLTHNERTGKKTASILKVAGVS